MQRHVGNANASTAVDRLEQLALVAGQIVSRGLSNQDPPRNCKTDWQEACRREAEMVALLDPIEEAAGSQQATTPPAALFQLLVAAADLGELWGTSNWDEDALHQRVERMEACVHSALNFFEQHCGLDRNELGGAYFARREYVPQAWQRRGEAEAQASN